MAGNADEKYMKRCLDLAVMAHGATYPNPMVGAVLVYNDTIIGEGYHIKAGGPHAEVIAIGSVSERHLIPRSTLYVSLEPCSHYGKTPPCADLILDVGIQKIIIGTTDTSINVAGNGVKKLRTGGAEVVVGIMEDSCRWINRRFFTYNEKRRPYIILKWAQSIDGFIDKLRPGRSSSGPLWISGKAERVLVHKWRSEEEAVLVGAGTVRNDNPSLNVRYWTGKDPIRIILSKSGETGNYPRTVPAGRETIVFTGKPADDTGNVRYIMLKEDEPAAAQITCSLYEKGIQSLMVEGGAGVLNHFIYQGLWDEARIFNGRTEFKEGIKAPEIGGWLSESFDFDATSLKTVINHHK